MRRTIWFGFTLLLYRVSVWMGVRWYVYEHLKMLGCHSSLIEKATTANPSTWVEFIYKLNGYEVAQLLLDTKILGDNHRFVYSDNTVGIMADTVDLVTDEINRYRDMLVVHLAGKYNLIN